MLRRGNTLSIKAWLLIGILYAYTGSVWAVTDSLFSNGEVISQSADAALVEWSSSYSNTGNDILRDVVLDMEVDSVQSIVPNSVKAPIGWSVEYSSDNGKTYSPQFKITANALRFFNSSVLPDDQGAGSLVSLPLFSSLNLNGGGDGYVPILLGDGRMMGVNHHQAKPNIWCYDLNKEAACAGYPRSLGDAPNGVAPMTALIEGKLYIGDDSGGSEYGQKGKLYCWDTESHKSCGQSPVVDGGGYAGPVAIDDKLYVLTRNYNIDCYDPKNSLKRCSGFSPVGVGVRSLPNKAWWNFGADLLVHNKRIYITSTEGKLSCFDSLTKKPCADWGTNPITTSLGYGNVFKRTSGTGSINGICVAGYRSNALCYNLKGTGRSVIEMSHVHRVRPGVNAQYEAYYGTRVIFAQLYPENNLSCWDWATNAACKGADMQNGTMGSGTLGSPYGVVSDGACVFSFGDAGKLMSWDPNTGSTPCVKASAKVNLSLDVSMCDPNNSYSWKSAKLFDTNLTKNKEFKSFKVRLVDPTTQQILTDFVELIGTKGEWDLSSISSNVRKLELHAEGVPVGKVAWQDNVMPKVGLTVSSKTPSQFCFQSNLSCGASSVQASHQVTSSTNLTQKSQVSACNLPPTLAFNSPVDYVTAQNKVVVDVSVSDDKNAEGNGIQYTLAGATASMFNINAQGHIRFKTEPKNTDSGKYELIVQATDEQDSAGQKALVVNLLPDLDGDGITDSKDDDIDGDGISNKDEEGKDLDGDGIPSSIDPDEVPIAHVGAHVILQGAYNHETHMMDDKLRQLGVLPRKQPYNYPPFNYEGTETLSDEVLAREGGEAVVDWILIELRKADNPTILAKQHAYVVVRNSEIIDPETGNWELKLSDVPPGKYYIVVRHRNHMDLASAEPLDFNSTIYPYDFTDFDVPIFGGERTRDHEDGKGMLWAGDVNGDGIHIYTGRGNDRADIYRTVMGAPGNTEGNNNYVLEFGYYQADVNMDGKVAYIGTDNDVFLLLSNILHHPANKNGNSNYMPVSSLRELLRSAN